MIVLGMFSMTIHVVIQSGISPLMPKSSLVMFEIWHITQTSHELPEIHIKIKSHPLLINIKGLCLIVWLLLNWRRYGKSYQ